MLTRSGAHAPLAWQRKCDRQPDKPRPGSCEKGTGHWLWPRDLLHEIQRKLRVEVVGVELRPPKDQVAVPILRCDAIRETLPPADIAVSLTMVHHLSQDELVRLIRNVGHSCWRFLILDLVRHFIPVALFRAFVAPFVNPINVEDGLRSIERAFTVLELTHIVSEALAGSAASFRLEVAPFCVRQIVDIRN